MYSTDARGTCQMRVKSRLSMALTFQSDSTIPASQSLVMVCKVLDFTDPKLEARRLVSRIIRGTLQVSGCACEPGRRIITMAIS